MPNDKEGGMKPEELGGAALGAILAGTDMTLYLPKGEKFPQGWPRGELLSVTEKGRNMSFNPIKVLAFMQKLGKLGNVPLPPPPTEKAK
jgi:hypothetical protein